MAVRDARKHRETGNRIVGWGPFQVPGLGRQDSGSGLQVQVQAPGLIPEPVPAPVLAADT